MNIKMTTIEREATELYYSLRMAVSSAHAWQVAVSQADDLPLLGTAARVRGELIALRNEVEKLLPSAEALDELRSLVDSARLLIVEAGEATDWPLQMRQHAWLKTANDIMMDAPSVSVSEVDAFLREYDQGKHHTPDCKTRKAQPEEVSMLDVILENQRLKGEIFRLKERVSALEAGVWRAGVISEPRQLSEGEPPAL